MGLTKIWLDIKIIGDNQLREHIDPEVLLIIDALTQDNPNTIYDVIRKTGLSFGKTINWLLKLNKGKWIITK